MGILGYRIRIREFSFSSVTSLITVVTWNFLFKYTGFDGLVVDVVVRFLMFISFYWWHRYKDTIALKKG